MTIFKDAVVEVNSELFTEKVYTCLGRFVTENRVSEQKINSNPF